MAAPHSPEFYRERSHRFLSLVDSMLALGEPEAACEMAWGAAHAIKAAPSDKVGGIVRTPCCAPPSTDW